MQTNGASVGREARRGSEPPVAAYDMECHELVRDGIPAACNSKDDWFGELGPDPKSGRMVSARMGKFGPCVQIGTRAILSQ